MSRGLWLAGLGAMALLTLAPAAAQAGSAATIIEPDGRNRFSPRTAEYIVLTNQFIWYWGKDGGGTSARRHDVVQDKGLFRSPGGPRTSFPGSPPGFVVSASAGTFPYHCSVHGGRRGEGMSGKIEVQPRYADPPTDDQIPIIWAYTQNTTGNRYDVRYKPLGGKWEKWKNNSAKEELVFGKNDKPIDVSPGQNIRFQARSGKAANPSKQSRWSPTFLAVADE